MYYHHNFSELQTHSFKELVANVKSTSALPFPYHLPPSPEMIPPDAVLVNDLFEKGDWDGGRCEVEGLEGGGAREGDRCD